MRQFGVLVFVVFAALVGHVGVSFAISTRLLSVELAKSGPKPLVCHLAGIRYVGTTTQGKRICLTLSRNGKTMREYLFVTHVKCSGAVPAATATTNLDPDGEVVRLDGGIWVSTGGQGPAIGQDGTFSFTPLGTQESTFRGTLERTGKATGTLREQVKTPTLDAVCDSGTVRWTARRVA